MNSLINFTTKPPQFEQGKMEKLYESEMGQQNFPKMPQQEVGSFGQIMIGQGLNRD